MSDDDAETLSDIIFGRTATEKHTGEVGIGASLALLVQYTSPDGWRGVIVYSAAAIVAILPFIRYFVYTGRYSDSGRFFAKSIRLLEFSAIICLVHLLDVIGTQHLAPYLSISKLGRTALVTVAATLLFVLSFESLLRTYRFSWGTLFYVKQLAMDSKVDVPLDDAEAVFDVIWGAGGYLERIRQAWWFLSYSVTMAMISQFAFYLLKDSIPEGDIEALDELREYIRLNSGGGSSGIVFAFGVSVFLVVPVLLGIAWLASMLLRTAVVSMVLALVIMRLARHIVGLSYIAFGHMEYHQYALSNARWLAQTAVYTVAVYVTFFYL